MLCFSDNQRFTLNLSETKANHKINIIQSLGEVSRIRELYKNPIFFGDIDCPYQECDSVRRGIQIVQSQPLPSLIRL
jgi:hypothetical protein